MSDKQLRTLQKAIKRLHGCDAVHVRTETVVESFEGRPAWGGQVEVFTLSGHAKAKHCYAWSFENDQGKQEHVAVLELPPVVDAQTAVQAYLVSLTKRL